jgi:hypothetical protein
LGQLVVEPNDHDGAFPFREAGQVRGQGVGGDELLDTGLGAAEHVGAGASALIGGQWLIERAGPVGLSGLQAV